VWGNEPGSSRRALPLARRPSTVLSPWRMNPNLTAACVSDWMRTMERDEKERENVDVEEGGEGGGETRGRQHAA